MPFLAGFTAWLGMAEPHFDPQARFVTSYLLTPYLLFAWRTVAALYTLITLIISYVHDGSDGFDYFTQWSYWGVTSYFAVSAIYTFSYARSYSRWQSSQTAPSPAQTEEGQEKGGERRPQSWLSRTIPRPLQFLYYLLWSTVCTFPLLVTIIFWTILSDAAFESVYSTWSNISLHALNLVLTFIEVVFFSRGPMLPWSHCLFCVCFLALYVGLAYLFYHTRGFYSYDFLNVQEHGQAVTAGYIVAVGVASVVSFMVGQFLVFCREWVAAKVQGSGQWGSAKAVAISDDALFITSRGPGPEGEGGRRSDSSDERAQVNNWRQRWPSTPFAA